MLAYIKIRSGAAENKYSYLIYERKVVPLGKYNSKNASLIKTKINCDQLVREGTISIEGIEYLERNLYKNDDAVRESKRTSAYTDEVRQYVDKFFYIAKVNIGDEQYIVDIIFYGIEPQFMLPSILTGTAAVANIVQRHLHFVNYFYSADNDAYLLTMDKFNETISKSAIYDLSTYVTRCDPAEIGMHTRLYDYQINDLNKLLAREDKPLCEVLSNDKIWFCENGLIFNYSQSKFVEFDDLRAVPIKGIVLAHQPGTGKTLIVLTYCALRQRPTAIIVPDHLYESGHWEMEICKHFIAPDKLAEFVKIFSFTDFSKLTPPEYNSFEAVFIDEAHEIYTTNDQDTDAKKKMKVKLYEILTSMHCRIKCLITGTPFAAGVDSMYKIICMLTDVNDPDKPYKFHYTPFIRNRVYEPTLELLFSRNTLDTVNHELNLPPANFNNVLLKFSQMEQDMMDSLLAANIDGADIDPTQRYSKYVNVEQLRKILSNVMTAVLTDATTEGYMNMTVKQVKELFLTQKRKEFEEQTMLFEKLQMQRQRLILIKEEMKIWIDEGRVINMPGIMASLRSKGHIETITNDESSTTGLKPMETTPSSRRMTSNQHHINQLLDIDYNIDHFTGLINAKAREVESKKAVFERYSKICEVIEEAAQRGDLATAEENFEADIDYDKACPICANALSSQIAIYECGHCFCKFCCDSLRRSGNQLCPCCRRRVTNDKITVVNNLKEQRFYGTKCNYIIDMIHRCPEDQQFVIFTQFDTNIKALSTVLTTEGISSVIYQGWNDVVDFRENKKRVIILSSMNQPSGLDLSFVSNIIILEPPNGEYSFRRDMERQIIGRILRIGQKEPVNVMRLIIRDSIETQLYVDL